MESLSCSLPADATENRSSDDNMFGYVGHIDYTACSTSLFCINAVVSRNNRDWK
jgi:hypothetical protein